MKVRFRYYEGDPDTIDPESSDSKNCKGLILDISKGGLFIATDTRVSVNLPVTCEFRTKKERFNIPGTIVRTGLIENNPSEIARKYRDRGLTSDCYVAVQFRSDFESFDETDLLES